MSLCNTVCVTDFVSCCFFAFSLVLSAAYLPTLRFSVCVSRDAVQVVFFCSNTKKGWSLWGIHERDREKEKNAYWHGKNDIRCQDKERPRVSRQHANQNDIFHSSPIRLCSIPHGDYDIVRLTTTISWMENLFSYEILVNECHGDLSLIFYRH